MLDTTGRVRVSRNCFRKSTGNQLLAGVTVAMDRKHLHTREASNWAAVLNRKSCQSVPRYLRFAWDFHTFGSVVYDNSGSKNGRTVHLSGYQTPALWNFYIRMSGFGLLRRFKKSSALEFKWLKPSHWGIIWAAIKQTQSSNQKLADKKTRQLHYQNCIPLSAVSTLHNRSILYHNLVHRSPYLTFQCLPHWHRPLLSKISPS